MKEKELTGNEINKLYYNEVKNIINSITDENISDISIHDSVAFEMSLGDIAEVTGYKVADYFEPFDGASSFDKKAYRRKVGYEVPDCDLKENKMTKEKITFSEWNLQINEVLHKIEGKLEKLEEKIDDLSKENTND